MHPTSPTLASALFFVLLSIASVARSQQGTPPDVVIPANPSSQEMERAREKIAEFLRKNKAAEAKASGDPVLDDVLDVIRRQGSVLDGSALDPNAPSEAIVPVPGWDADRGSAALQGSDAGYVAAEHLLKAARSLQQVQSRSREDAELVRAMRRRAAKLMIDTLSRDPATQDAQWQGTAP